MSLSSEFGKPPSFICCESCMHSEETKFRDLIHGKHTITLGHANLLIFTWHRFRQVPTFGGGTIWKFHTNVSRLKKLAARDFEDILQVCSHVCISCLLSTNVINMIHSALCCVSRAYYQSHSIALSLTCFGLTHAGTPLQSFGCTPKPLWTSWMTSHGCSELPPGSLHQLVRISIQGNFYMKKRLAGDGKSIFKLKQLGKSLLQTRMVRRLHAGPRRRH